jgi:hypothetical protein
VSPLSTSAADQRVTGVTRRCRSRPCGCARPLERHDEDLAVADLAGPAAVAERLDRRLDELVGHRDLEAHLVGQPTCTVVPR